MGLIPIRHEISKAVLKPSISQRFITTPDFRLAVLPLQSNLAIGVAAFVYRAIGRSLVKKGGVCGGARNCGPGGS